MNDNARQMYTPKIASDFQRKTLLPWAGFEHTTSCTIDGCSFFLGKVTALGVLCCFALLFI